MRGSTTCSTALAGIETSLPDSKRESVLVAAQRQFIAMRAAYAEALVLAGERLEAGRRAASILSTFPLNYRYNRAEGAMELDQEGARIAETTRQYHRSVDSVRSSGLGIEAILGRYASVGAAEIRELAVARGGSSLAFGVAADESTGKDQLSPTGIAVRVVSRSAFGNRHCVVVVRRRADRFPRSRQFWCANSRRLFPCRASRASISTMMRQLSIVGLALAALVYASAASAAEAYQFRLNRGIYAVGITPGCEIDGQYTLTGAVIQSAAIPPNPPPDLEALTWTQAVLTVCTRFGDIAQERAPIPLSTSLLPQSGPAGRRRNCPLRRRSVAGGAYVHRRQPA